MTTTDPLIRTKLRLPLTRSEVVPRLRLREQIVQGLRGLLTLVIAPAGFGKTTLVASSVAACGLPVGWVSLDAGDNQVGRFLTYLCAALQGVDPHTGDEATQLLGGVQPAPTEVVLTSLINDLDASEREIVLVLDDYQFINNPAIHAGVTFLLEHCPPTFHLVMATRSDPPLPLARMRARDQLVELRAADLRFTEGEAAQFLNEVMGLNLDPGSVALLDERTEGWVAGLQMAALSMRNREDVRGFIANFSGTNRHILDYLMEEILSGQTPEIQRFLLHTSVLERLCAPLCDELLTEMETSGGETSGASLVGPVPPRQSTSVLEYLDQQNLFLVALDDERIWYRYHHLFADLLRARLHQAEPDIVPLLHVRASIWSERRGFIQEAIQHLFAAHEMARAADLIEPYGPARWAESDTSVVQMADGLPREILVTRPKLGLYLAWLLICQGRIERAVPLMNDLAEYLNSAETGARYHWVNTIISIALAYLSGLAKSPGFDLAQAYLDLNEIPTEEVILRDAADILYVLVLTRLGEIDRAAEIAFQFIEREKSKGGTLGVSTLVSFLARIYLEQGHLHTAAALCREYLDPIKEKGLRLISTAGSLNIVLGEVLYEWNRLDEAEQLIRDGLQANETWANILTDAFGLLALTNVLQGKGDTAGALQAVEKFESRMQEGSQPREFAEDFRTRKARLQLRSGDLYRASQWADGVRASQDYLLHGEYYRLTLARVYLAQGRFDDTENILIEGSSPAGEGSRLFRRIESDLLMAAARAGQKRLSEALDLLESCLALAEPEGFIRTFVDIGEPVRDLLSAYLGSARSGHKPYAHQLLDAFSATAASSSPRPPTGGLVEPLTERELEVLQYIALGKTNQAIAQYLVVAPGTIKAHTANIFRKLDVMNRTEAVAKARQLGILP